MPLSKDRREKRKHGRRREGNAPHTSFDDARNSNLVVTFFVISISHSKTAIMLAVRQVLMQALCGCRSEHRLAVSLTQRMTTVTLKRIFVAEVLHQWKWMWTQVNGQLSIHSDSTL